MQQAIEELEQSLKHLAKTERWLPAGQVHDQDHYRQRILWDAKAKLEYLLSLLKRDPRAAKHEKEEPCKP